MNPHEFERLCHSIERTVNQAARLIDKNSDIASDAIHQAVNAYKRASDQRAAARQPGSQRSYPPERLARRFASSAGLTASGAAMAGAGGLLTASFLILALLSLVGTLPGIPFAGHAAVVFALFAILSGCLLGAGVGRLRCSGQFKALRRIFGDREACSIEELAARLGTSESKALRSARSMIKRGLLPEGRFDDDDTYLMVTDEAYGMYRQAQQDYARRLEEQKAREEQTAQRDAQLPEAVRSFVNEGRGYMRTLRSLDEAIDDASVSGKIVKIEDVVRRILERVQDEPSTLNGMERLTSYYLPTTVKLLEAYDELEHQPTSVSSIAQSRTEIEQTLDVLHAAFEKLLDESYRDLTIDVSSDITALNAILAQDGLARNPFEKR